MPFRNNIVKTTDKMLRTPAHTPDKVGSLLLLSNGCLFLFRKKNKAAIDRTIGTIIAKIAVPASTWHFVTNRGHKKSTVTPNFSARTSKCSKILV